MPETQTKQMWNDFCGARKSYERLLLLQPHIRVSGLWQKDYRFFVVCPDLQDGLLTHDGQPLNEWWNDSARVLCAPMELVSAVPEGAVRLPERDIDELANLRGTPLTIPDIETLLGVALPCGFPAFGLETIQSDAFLYVETALSPAQTRLLYQHFEPIGADLHLKVIVDPARSKSHAPVAVTGGGMNLVTSKRLAASFGAAAKVALEEDEDFWMRNRTKLFTGGIDATADLVPKAFRPDAGSCLVDASVFPPANLRTYLSLYNKILIVMPLDIAYTKALEALRATEDEVVELASRGRVQFVMPQSVHRYPPQLVSRLAELDNKPILLSRRLATLTVSDARRRIPFLYPPFGVADRRSMLEEFLAIANDAPTETAKAIAVELGRIWCSAEEQIYFLGAMGTGLEGIGPLLAARIKAVTGSQVLLEMYRAAASVEWAAALGASVFPIQIDTYSDEAAVGLCASTYSGVPIETPGPIGRTEIVIESLLALDDDAPIIEVADVFSGHDTDRLRKLVYGAVRSSSTAEELQKLVNGMNQRVKQFDHRMSHQTRSDFLALAGALAVFVPGVPLLKFLNLGTYLLKQVFQNAQPNSATTKRVVDWLRATNAWTTSDVVLVSRLRKDLKS
jgi:hypothetical protein